MESMKVEKLQLVFHDATIWQTAAPRAGKQRPTGFKPRS